MPNSSTEFKKGKKPGPGRPKGLPNKATQDARAAIGMFVEGNAHRLQGWLDQIAEGIQDPADSNKYLVTPNPEKAFNLFNNVIEFHVPKLARSEVTHSGTLTLAQALKALEGEDE